jgi:hypothetical protein
MPLPQLSRNRGLSLLALWAVILSVESFFRSPGAILTRAQPPRRILLNGALYERLGDTKATPRQSKKIETLPNSTFLVRHWLVNYRRVSPIAGPHSAAGGSDLQLAFIEAKGTGRAGVLPMNRVLGWMAAERGGLEGPGGCLVRGEDRVVLVERQEEWDRLMALRRDRRSVAESAKIPLWLAGLRGIEEVNCLWIQSREGMSQKDYRSLYGLF